MGRSVLIAFVLLLAAYGCAEMIVRTMERICLPPSPRGVYVIALQGGEVECVLRGLMAQKRCPIIVMDTGLDRESRQILGCLQQEYEELYVCLPENFATTWRSCLG